MSKQEAKTLDWRLQASSTLTKPFKDPNTGHVFAPGSEVTLFSVVKLGKRQYLGLPVPNATAMFLHLSMVSYKRTARLLSDKAKRDIRGSTSVFKEHSYAIDWIESAASAAVFACTALEAFANEMIPDDYAFTSLRDDNRCTETYNKVQIERHLSLDTKLADVLPEVLSCASPRGKELWQRYVALRHVRDRVVHLKSQDRQSSSPEDDTIWAALVSLESPHLIAKDVIDYFLKNVEKKPFWSTRFPKP